MSVVTDINRILTEGIPQGNEYVSELVPKITELVEKAKRLQDEYDTNEAQLKQTKKDLVDLSNRIMDMARKQGADNIRDIGRDETKKAQTIEDTRRFLKNIKPNNRSGVL